MTIKFKRSKKLEHALKCMRESMRDQGKSHLSVSSSASMSDDDDDDDDTTVDIEQSSEPTNSSSFSQDERPARIDPEERLDVKDRLGIHREDGQQNTMKLFKVANSERVRREGLVAATDDIDTTDSASIVYLRKKIENDNHVEVKATPPIKGMHHNTAREMEQVTPEKNSRGGDPKQLDDYQKELFGAIAAFEARRVKRLEQLGFDDESTLSFDKTVKNECTSEPSRESYLSKEPPASMTFEDRHDASAQSAINLPAPSHPAQKAVEKVHQPISMAAFTSRLPAPRPVRKQPNMMAGKQTNASERQVQNMMAELRATILDQNGATVPDRQHAIRRLLGQRTGTKTLDRKETTFQEREQANMMARQRTSTSSAREQPNMTTAQQTNPQPNRMVGQPPRKHGSKQAEILAHLTEVANHLVQQNQLLQSSGNSQKADLNRRILQENTSELLRNLAILRGHASIEQPSSGKMIHAKVDKGPKKAETREMEHPANARLGPPQTNIASLREKRDRAAQNVRRETQKLTSMLESSILEEARQNDLRKKGYYGGRGMPDEEYMLAKLPSKVRRSKKKPSPEQEVSWQDAEDSKFGSHYDDRANRLDRVKSMLEELRYLRSSQYSDE